MFNSRSKEILRLAIPSITSNITIPLLGLIDLAIVGHIGDQTYISAIAVGTMAFNIMYWLLGFLRMGTSGLTSQAYGRSDRLECLALLLRSLTIGLGMGCMFVLMQVPLCKGLFFVLDVPLESVSLASTYFGVVIFGAPAMLGLYGLMGWFIGMQDTRTPMLIAILQNVVNIISSLFCVYLLNWHMEGVATGTLLAQWFGFLLSLYMAYRKVRGLHLKAFSVSYYKKVYIKTIKGKAAWLDFFAVNRNIFLRTLCLVIVNMFFTKAGGLQGTMILAVNTLLMTLFTIFSYFMDGFAYAAEALSGKYYGAKDVSTLRLLIKQLFIFGGVVALLFTALYAFGGLRFLHLLTSDDKVVSSALPYLYWACFIPIAGVTAFIMDGIFVGLTETKGMLWSCFIAAAMFFLVYFMLRGKLYNDALWLGFLSFLLTRGVVELWWIRHNTAICS